MVKRGDRNTVATPACKLAKRRVEGEVWRGLDLHPDENPQFKLRVPHRWFPLRSRPRFCGWYAIADRKRFSKASSSGSLICRIEWDGATTAQIELALGDSPTAIEIPWPEGAIEHRSRLELVLHAPASTPGPVFVAVHKALDRDILLDLATGDGVEIGPGPKPQVKPSRGTSVHYVEQMPPDEWHRRYNKTGKFNRDTSLWDHYLVGEANRLPVDPGSLDFVFSSHVFEHLADPIGHLRHWCSKLRAGGRVLAVVPDLGSTKDYVFHPTSLDELLLEDSMKLQSPTLEHYRHWVEGRGTGQDPESLMAQRWSIHVHYYTKSNITDLLEYAVSGLRFFRYEIWHEPNHKDFYFSLTKSWR